MNGNGSRTASRGCDQCCHHTAPGCDGINHAPDGLRCKALSANGDQHRGLLNALRAAVPGGELNVTILSEWSNVARRPIVPDDEYSQKSPSRLRSSDDPWSGFQAGHRRQEHAEACLTRNRNVGADEQAALVGQSNRRRRADRALVRRSTFRMDRSAASAARPWNALIRCVRQRIITPEYPARLVGRRHDLRSDAAQEFPRLHVGPSRRDRLGSISGRWTRYLGLLDRQSDRRAVSDQSTGD
jgi:hypothetical protein